MQTKTRINIIVGVLLCLSIMGNIAFLCAGLRHSRQAGAAGEHLEQSIVDAKSSVSSATGLIESGNNKLTDVSTGLSASRDTAGQLDRNIESSTAECKDAISTIAELRKEIEVLANNYDNSSSSSSGSNSSDMR